jgi:outer membrane protein OmpA-like peptidoglycan-associated protein
VTQPVPEPVCEHRILFFASGSAALDGAARTMLESFMERGVADMLPSSTLVIVADSDSIGPAAANMRLSRRRTESVRRFLLDRGFPASRLRVRAMGEQRQSRSSEGIAGAAIDRSAALVEYGFPGEIPRGVRVC